MKIVFEPKAKYLKQLEKWLFDEKNKGLSKTYYNFLHQDFTTNNFAGLINENDQAIGYIKYNFYGMYSSIDNAIIKNDYQNKGFGKLLLEKLTELLLERGTLVLKLYCEPHSSKDIWVKLGFLGFKEIEQHKYLNSKNFIHPWLYKPIVEVLKPTSKQTIFKKIELWTKEDYKVKEDEKPNYIWDVSKYELPVIYPVDDNWKIKFSIDGQEKYNGKVKRFIGGVYSQGNFLIIKNN